MAQWNEEADPSVLPVTLIEMLEKSETSKQKVNKYWLNCMIQRPFIS